MLSKASTKIRTTTCFLVDFGQKLNVSGGTRQTFAVSNFFSNQTVKLKKKKLKSLILVAWQMMPVHNGQNILNSTNC